MAGNALTPLRGNLASVGWIKEANWGTALAATSWWQWLDGTDAALEPKIAQERQGDTSPYINLAYKQSQSGMIKVVEYARPRTMGCALQAILGTGSDTYTAPTKSTTLAASIVVGATTFQSTADLGNVGSMAMNFTPGLASATYEVQTVNLASRTGAGPYTYTLANSATFRNAHSNSDAITSASSHAFTRQLVGYDPYSIDMVRGDGVNNPFQLTRFHDCVCTDLTLTHQARKPLRLEHSWYAAGAQLVSGAFPTVTLESQNVIGYPGAPFMFHQISGNVLIDGASTGNAVTVEQIAMKIKNTTNVDEFVLESVNPAFFTPDNFDMSIQMTVVFQNFNQYYETYFGSSAPANNASDSYQVGYGTFQVTWVEDAINQFVMNATNVAYMAAKIPQKLDGKPVRQQIMLLPLKSLSVATPLTLTLSNSQNSAY